MFFRKTAFSSESNEWATPLETFRALDYEFGFTLDPCSTHENAKCEKHYTKKENGLEQDWSNEVVFMNPPYGNQISAWVEKAYIESLRGAVVVCLIPARTDTSYWHDYIFKYANDIRFLRGRIKFVGEVNDSTEEGRNSAPFPSAVVVFMQSP